MGRNTSVSLGDYFEGSVESRIAAGRFKNASEVIRAGLRLWEAEENRVMALRNAIQEGVGSGIAKDFQPEQHLAQLKARKKRLAKYFLTHKGVGDPARIWEYTYDTWSERKGDKYHGMLTAGFQEILAQPELGNKYPEVAEGVKGH